MKIETSDSEPERAMAFCTELKLLCEKYKATMRMSTYDPHWISVSFESGEPDHIHSYLQLRMDSRAGNNLDPKFYLNVTYRFEVERALLDSST